MNTKTKTITPKDIKKAIKVLSIAMREDPAFAWGWHCNIAMVAQDAGAPHEQANKQTAAFMRHTFNVDIKGY